MIRTTNFIFTPENINFAQKLEKEYKLVCYVLQANFKDYLRYSDKRNGYAKFQNCYKELLEKPCYYNLYEKKIYVLYKKADSIKELIFRLTDSRNQPKQYLTTCQELAFDSIPKHTLVKVLLADFFYKRNKIHRICQHQFYIFGRMETDKSGNEIGIATGVEIRLRERIRNNQIEYFIISQAKKFSLVNNIETKYLYSNQYFEKITLSATSYFRQIKPSKVLNFHNNSKKQLWRPSKTSIYSKAHLEWHTDDVEQQKETKEYLVFKFQERFVNFLNKMLGQSVAKPKHLNAKSFKPSVKPAQITGISKTGLPIYRLGKIYVFDNRLKENGITINTTPIEDYIKKFNDFDKDLMAIDKNHKVLGVTFEHIENTNNFSPKKPILVLQDVTGNEFETKEEQEQKNLLFEDLPSENTSQEKPNQDGFLYQMKFTDPKHKLYDNYGQLIALQSLRINSNKCKNKAGKPRYNTESYKDYFDYNLYSFFETTIIKSGKRKGQPKTKKTGFFHKFNVCVNELLLKYCIINQAPVWGDIRECILLPCLMERPKLVTYMYQTQEVFLYINQQKQLTFIDLTQSKGKRERTQLLKNHNIDWQSVQNNFLDKYWLKEKSVEKKNKKLHATKFIFTKDTVIEIEEGTVTNDPVERVLFPYDKGNKIRIGSKKTTKTDYGINGVWYDKETNSYVVGRPKSNTYKFGNMDKAHIIRKFDFYQKAANFKLDDILETLAVQFVRNRQYTVYPYFFDLIRLYKDICDL